MHVPDGPLSIPVCLAAGVTSAAAVGYSLRRLSGELADRMVPYTGMTAALIFAAQMLNFPLLVVPTSGHLMGGVLAASVIGPWAGCVALTLVLLVQCLMFSDGGLWALGVNVLHMAVIGSIGGYFTRNLLWRMWGGGTRAYLMASGLAAWLTVVAAASLFSLEFVLSFSTAGLDLGRLATLMVSVHSAVGVGEALITVMSIAFLLKHRPALLQHSPAEPGTGAVQTSLIGGLTIALALIAFLAPMASSLPDGFEAVAQRVGLQSLVSGSQISVLQEYEVPAPVSGWDQWPAWQWASTVTAGIGGCLSVFLIGTLVARRLAAYHTT